MHDLALSNAHALSSIPPIDICGSLRTSCVTGSLGKVHGFSTIINKPRLDETPSHGFEFPIGGVRRRTHDRPCNLQKIRRGVPASGDDRKRRGSTPAFTACRRLDQFG